MPKAVQDFRVEGFNSCKQLLMIMKQELINKFLVAVVVVSSAFIFQSCLDDDDNDYNLLYPNALVTVRADGESFYLQLDDSTKIKPSNITASPYGKKQVRALANLTMSSTKADAYKTAVVNWMDSILTKKPVVTQGIEKDKELYGEDPIDIMNDWMTVCEDGYMTIHFAAYWGNTNVKHVVNLVSGTNPDNPYELVFRHDSKKDERYVYRDGIVAFDLSGLPDTEGKKVKLKISWKSLQGDKTVEFSYCTRKD